MKIYVICDDRYHPGGIVMEGLQFLQQSDHKLEFSTVASTDDLSNAAPDLIILCKGQIEAAEGDRGLWMDSVVEQWFFEYVRTGGKLLVLHSGIVIAEENTSFRSLVGGAFSHHPDPCPIVYAVVGDSLEDAAIEDIKVVDEQYFIDFASSRDSLEIFLESRSEHGRQPAGWFCKESNGMVAVLTPGHFPAVWQHEDFKKLVTLCIDRLGESR